MGEDQGYGLGQGGELRKANGRRACLEMLDVLLADHHNIQKLKDAMQERMDEDPLTFFQEVVKPLIPARMLEDSGGTDTDARRLLQQIHDMTDSVGGPEEEEE